MKEKLLANALAAAMLAANLVPVYAEEVQNPTEYMTDLTSYYNYDTLAHLGDTLGDNFWYNENNRDVDPAILSELDGKKVLRIDEEVLKEQDGSIVGEKTGASIPFLMSEEALNGSVNDSVILKTTAMNAEDTVIALSGNRTDSLYFIIDSCQDAPTSAGVDAVIEYADGTKEAKHINLANSMQASVAQKANTDYAGRNATWGGEEYGRIMRDSESGKAVLLGSGACWMEFTMLKMDVDESKALKSITFKPLSVGMTGEKYAAVLYGITEIPMSNDAIKAKIAANTITEATAENAEEIVKLNSLADELIKRNAAAESDFAELRQLLSDAEFFLNMQDPENYTWDLTNYFDKDTIAYEGDTLGDNWYTLSDNNNIMASLMKNSMTDGVYTHKEQTVSKSGDSYAWQETGKTVPFAFDETALKGKVNDAIIMDSTVNDGTVTIDAAAAGGENRAREMYLLMYPGSYGTLTADIVYEDGTKEETAVSVKKDRDATNLKDYPATAGYWYIGGWRKIKNENNVATGVAGEPHLNVFKLSADPSKKINTLSLKYKEGWGNTTLTIYAITTLTLSNSEMKTYIDGARSILSEDGYTTVQNTDTAKTANAYLDELVRRSAVKAADYTDIAAFSSQAEAQEIIYSKLPYDTDIFAKAGDTADLDISQHVMNVSELTDINGFVTLDKEPADAQFTDEELGRKFKIFGAHAGEKDAVSLENKSFTLDTNGKMLKKVAAAIYYDPILYGNEHENGSIDVTVNYADGTSEIKTLPVYSCSSWFTAQQNANAWTYEMKKSDGKWTTQGYAEGVAGIKMVSSAFEVSAKPVKSIQYGASDKFMAIAAITQVPYTNDELMTTVLDMEDSLTNDTVTEENAQTVLDGCTAMTELTARGYELPASEAERYERLRVKANRILSHEEAVLSFGTPEVVIGDQTASASAILTNTTDDDADYIMIIAAYDANEALIGIETSGQMSLKSGTKDYRAQVSMDKAGGAKTYRAFIWKDMQSMIPLTF